MNEAQVRHDLIDLALKAAVCALLRKVILMESVV